jgi:hypothetical protein
MIDIVKNLAQVAQGVSALFTAIVLLVRPFRNWLFGIQAEKEKAKKESAQQKDSTKCLLRSEIVRIYYKYASSCEIPAYEFENTGMLYKAYKDLGGNSFIDKIWNEMQDWSILP